MADIQDRHSGQNGPGKVLFHNEQDGTFSESVASHLRGWDTTDLAWYRLPVDHATGALLVKATLAAGSVDVGLVDQGTGGSSAWLVSGGANVFHVDDNSGSLTIDGTVAVSNAFALDATLTGGNQQVQGNVASGVADAGNPVLAGGAYVAAPASLTDGQRTRLITGIKGDLRVTGIAGNVSADGQGAPGLWIDTGGVNRALTVGPQLFNGTSWDRQRSNFNTTTGDAGAKTATFAGATQTNYNARGAIITVRLGTVSGTTPTLVVQLQYSPDAGTTWINYGAAASAVSATNNTVAINVYPDNGSPTTGATQTVNTNGPLPRTWRLNYTIAGTNPSFTFTEVDVNYVV